MDLEVAGADRRLDAVAVAARVGERRRDRRLARAEEAKRRVDPAVARREHRLQRRARERGRPEPAQLAGRAREHDDDARRRPPRRARRRACRADHVGTLGDRGLLRTPAAKSAYGRRSRSATCARSPRSGARARRRHERPPATRATSSTVRSSWVGPRPPETRQRSASLPRPERVLELVRVVADDRDPRGLETEGERLAREERAVQVGALAADELAAGDDDRRAGRAHPAEAGTSWPLRGRRSVAVELHDDVARPST